MAFGGKPHRILPDRVRQTRPYPCAMDDGKQMEIDSATGQTNVRAFHWPRSCAHCESMLASVAARVNRAMSNVVAIDARRLVESDIVVNLAQGFCRISSPLGGERPLAVYVARRLRELEVEVELQDVVQDRPKESVPSVPLEFATVLLSLGALRMFSQSASFRDRESSSCERGGGSDGNRSRVQELFVPRRIVVPDFHKSVPIFYVPGSQLDQGDAGKHTTYSRVSQRVLRRRPARLHLRPRGGRPVSEAVVNE
jgi:hypothetical protein